MTRTRFAPAPTGFLHLGHVLNAQYVWGLAREHGARVVLRIEDHDRERCRPEYEHAILDDLDWLGFAPDLYSTDAFRAGHCESRQSDRHAIYEAAAADLAGRGLLYGCACSRQQIADASAAGTTHDELKYPGTCRDHGLALTPDVTWRVRMDPGPNTFEETFEDTSDETFDDLLCGPQSQNPSAQCGDVAIRDRKGNWTYQFVASVDDFRQGIDLVIRGRDLLASTGRQIRIARLLGRPTPAVFAHHPLIMRTATQKLSKSDGATGIRELRKAGMTREQVLELVVQSSGRRNHDDVA